MDLGLVGGDHQVEAVLGADLGEFVADAGRSAGHKSERAWGSSHVSIPEKVNAVQRRDAPFRFCPSGVLVPLDALALFPHLSCPAPPSANERATRMVRRSRADPQAVGGVQPPTTR